MRSYENAYMEEEFLNCKSQYMLIPPPPPFPYYKVFIGIFKEYLDKQHCKSLTWKVI